jgi:hypothetical protein
MRFPVNVTRQTRCTVCKKAGPGRNPLAIPRAETARLSFVGHSFVHSRSYPVFHGGHLILGWDSGVSKNPQSRVSLGASVSVAKKEARDVGAGQLEVQFCSAACLRQFLMARADELERRCAGVLPHVEAARQRSPARRSIRKR